MRKNRKELLKVGAVFLSMGLLGMYLALFRPIQLALHGVPSITTSLGGMVITPVVAILGATYLFFPKFVERHLGFPGQKATDETSVTGAIFLIVAFSVAIGLAIWAQSFLHRLGYGS